MTAKVGGAANRRQLMCDQLWPDAQRVTYNYRDGGEKGFCTIPRMLPMIAALAKRLTTKLDPSAVYLELWARDMSPPGPHGFVEIDDEEECANSVGFIHGYRALRSWRERLDALETLGLIRTKPKGSRDRAYVLLLHPHRVVEELREAGLVPDWWWTVFTHRMVSVGATLPGPVPEPPIELAGEDDLPF